MILRAIMSAATCALVLASAGAARADVLEIGTDGEARWITGEAAEQALVAPPAALEEVPAEALARVPEAATADTARGEHTIPQQYKAYVRELAARFDLSPALLEAVVWQESRWRENAVSPAGARGLAQLMPGTARDLGVDPDDPRANLEGGARYLREQLDRFDGDLEKALAAYNAGPGRVIRANGIPQIRETRMYVASIMGRLSDYSRSAE